MTAVPRTGDPRSGRPHPWNEGSDAATLSRVDLDVKPEPSEAERGAIEAALAEAQVEQDPGGSGRGPWWRRGLLENASEDF